MKTIKFLIFICVAFISSIGGGQAADVKYDIIEESTRVKIVITIKSLKITDFGEPEFVGRYPCRMGDDKGRYCMFSYSMVANGASYGGSSIYTKHNVTAAEGLDDIVANSSVILFYIPNVSWQDLLSKPPVCLVFIYWINGPQGASSTNSCDGSLPPLPIPDPISCSMSDITLEHGVINLSDVNGHQASKSSFISCNGKGTGSVTVNVSVLNNGKITLDSNGQLKSQIYVNDVAGGKTMTIPDNGASVSIMSKLTADAGAMLNGSFQKSSTIVLNIL